MRYFSKQQIRNRFRYRFLFYDELNILSIQRMLNIPVAVEWKTVNELDPKTVCFSQSAQFFGPHTAQSA